MWTVRVYHIYIYFTLSIKRHDYQKNVTEIKIYVLVFSATFVLNISHYMKNPVRYCHLCTVHRSLRKGPSFLSDFNKNWISSTNSRKIHKCQISWKSVQWELRCSTRADGQTDTTILIVAFCSFGNANKKIVTLNCYLCIVPSWIFPLVSIDFSFGMIRSSLNFESSSRMIFMSLKLECLERTYSQKCSLKQKLLFAESPCLWLTQIYYYSHCTVNCTVT